jgi:hypothetical protein
MAGAIVLKCLLAFLALSYAGYSGAKVAAGIRKRLLAPCLPPDGAISSIIASAASPMPSAMMPPGPAMPMRSRLGSWPTLCRRPSIW